MLEYLAHISDDKSREQTVEEHLRNVSEFANVLGEKIGVGNIASLCGLLHDIGKFTDEFNAYIRQGDLQKSGKKGPDHSTAGAVYVVEKFKNYTVEQNDFCIGALSQLVALVVMSHHSGLVDVWTGTDSPYLKRLDKLQSDENWQRLYSQVLQNLPANFENQIDELFAKALVEFKHICTEIANSNCGKDYALGMLCKVLFSILIDADRYDTATFMDNMPMVKPADNQCLWDSYTKTLEHNLAKLPKVSAIDKLRWQISDTCLENAKNVSGIYTLNCPTGSGKTLASLRYAINHAKEMGKERIFYIIPFITITEQNAAVARDMLSLEVDSDSILEIHSAVEVENFDLSNVDLETLNEHELLVERMEAPLVFTTMVRFLNTIFASGTKNMRPLHQFANSVIIFDEIQTISPKHIAIFNEAIKFLEKICNCTIILSTATQPALDNLPEDIPAIEFGKPKDIANCTPGMFKAFERTKFVDCRQKAKTVDEMANFVWEKANENESLLVILNTKSAVSQLYKKMILEPVDNREIYVLSTDLYPADRKKIIRKIGERLGSTPIIVISTQLIEAGVDLSFNCVIRSLAGLDSIIQGGGRCNRHGEGNIAPVYLVDTDFENLNKLKEIKSGKDIVAYALDAGIMSGDNLASQELISAYFSAYYNGRNCDFHGNNLLKYNVEVNGVTISIFEMLDNNKTLRSESKSNLGIKKQYWLNQSFKMAAGKFNAIEEYGSPVVVGVDEAKKLMDQLANSNYQERKNILKKLQQFTVNLTDWQKSEIGEGIHYDEKNGIAFLSEDFYDEVLGVVTKNKLEFMCL